MNILYTGQLKKITLTFSLLLVALVANAQWTKTNGPYGGYIIDMDTMGNDLFAATQAGTLYRSSNFGNRWTDISNGLQMGQMLVVGSDLFTTSSRGTYLSTNKGATWTSICSGLPLPYLNYMQVVGGSCIVGAQGNDIYSSTNNGTSWKLAGTVTPALVKLAASGTNLFAATNGGGMLLSSDSGATWTPINTGLSANMVVKYLNVAGSNIFCATSGNLYRSTNNGSSWTFLGAVGNPLPSMFSSYTMSGTTLFAGSDNTYNGVSFSTNNGTSWTQVNTGLSCRLVTSVASIGTHVFAGTWAGVYSSTNNGANWAEKDSGLNSKPAYCLIANGKDLYAGSFMGGVYFSQDSGISWTQISNGLPFETIVVALAMQGTDLFAATSNGIFLSTNNGASWTSISASLNTPADKNVMSICLKGSDIFIGTQTGMLVSSNKGSSWTKIGTVATGGSVSQILMKGTDLFVRTVNGVFLSSNSGATWAATNTGLPSTLVGSIATDGVNLFAGMMGQGGVWMSTNNGASWSEISNGLPIPNKIVRSLAVDGTDLYAGVGATGVYVSRDTGKNWLHLGPGLDSSTVGVVAAAGRIYGLPVEGAVWVYGPLTTPGLSVPRVNSSSYRLYPNPITQSAVLEFDNPGNERAALAVFDVMGKAVYSMENIHGSSVNIPRNNLRSGLYYFKLQTESHRVASGKFVVE
jgi:photosystem II stability/assembly factor-like uncharacterized protein